MPNLCVFCGANAGLSPSYAEAARAVGRKCAERGVGVVYGGGRIGLMGQLADAALDAGGQVFGVIPETLVRWEVAHQNLTQLHVVDSMHERKAMMSELADAFLALPGGFGTLEEFCEVLTWAQLGMHSKPLGLLNVGGYYDPLLAMFDRAEKEGFVREPHRKLVKVADDAMSMLSALLA